MITTGPSGSGKTSLTLALAARVEWRVIPTLTTRPARESDTKVHVTAAEMDALPVDSYRTFEYDGHRYATPLGPVSEAAQSREPTAISDWVHPHPEDLSQLGPYVLGVVLLPPADAVASRLRMTGRRDRVTRALAEHSEISGRRTAYHPPWFLIEGNLTLAEIESRVIELAERVRNSVP